MLYLRGNILYMADRQTLCTIRHGCLAIKGNTVEGVYKEKDFEKLTIHSDTDMVADYGDCLIIPGMADMHLHAPQYAFRGLGMDCELLDWLEKHAFLEEEKYSDLKYADRAYRMFLDDLQKSPTTRACLFGTVHRESTLILAKLLDSAGYPVYVGKVNMDRNSPAGLREPSAEVSVNDTLWFIEKVQSECRLVKPILTPRFVPSCSHTLLEALGELCQEYALPVQSHLSENPSETKLVQKLFPGSRFYGDVYHQFGLFGAHAPAVMAHCVYSGEEELAKMKENDVFIAHCPNSNTSLASGIAPIRKYWDYGLSIGLGTDIAGGFSLSMLRAIQDAVSVSKLYWRLVDSSCLPLTFSQAFYMATAGGGAFFGKTVLGEKTYPKTGTFLPGCEADAVILDDSGLPCPFPLNPEERLERLCYLADSDVVAAKYIQGRLVYARDTTLLSSAEKQHL